MALRLEVNPALLFQQIEWVFPSTNFFFRRGEIQRCCKTIKKKEISWALHKVCKQAMQCVFEKGKKYPPIPPLTSGYLSYIQYPAK